MSIDSVIKYHDHLWNKARRHLKDFLVNQQPDDLHHFRTNIKHLRAVFNLISFFDDDFNPHQIFKVINRMYDSSGEIRDDYITQQLIQKYKLEFLLPPDYQMKVDEHRKKLKDFYRHTASTWSSIKVKGHKHLKHITENDFELFATYMLNKMKKAMATAQTDKEFHLIRKDIRQYLTLIHLLEKTALTPIETVNLEELDNIQHLIGCRHDMEKLLKKISNKNDAEGIKPNVAKVVKEKQKLTAEILSAFKKY